MWCEMSEAGYNNIIWPDFSSTWCFVHSYISIHFVVFRFCNPVEHATCGRFLLNHPVLFNTSNSHSRDQVDGIISILDQAAVNSSQSRTECLNLAQAVICHSVFPFCYDRNSPSQICKNTCDIFRPGGPCGNIINEETFPGAQELIFLNCDVRSDPAGTSPECIHVPFGEKLGMC